MWLRNVLGLLVLVGVTSCFPDSRIVNGTDSHITRYPFVASLRSASGSHSCGCSLIAPRWILTAAHCVDGRSASKMAVQFAVTDINVSGPNIAKVQRIFMHENYAPVNSYANDIALLQLVGTIVFNFKTLAPVTLPPQNYETPQRDEGAPGVLIGWGLNATGGYIQQVLQEVSLKIFSDEECSFRHEGAVSSDHICGGVDEGGKGQCSGDSGGPLLHVTENGIVQVGIVSWSIKPCAVYPYPGVFTKVSHYINWINNIINSNLVK